MAYYVAYYMAWYMAYCMAWYRSAHMARLWRMVGACGVWMARLWRAGCGSAMAYGWRLWSMVGACGVWLAPMAYGWRLWRAGCGSCGRSTACGCRLCVVPMCRHGCAYVSSWRSEEHTSELQ